MGILATFFAIFHNPLYLTLYIITAILIIIYILNYYGVFERSRPVVVITALYKERDAFLNEIKNNEELSQKESEDGAYEIFKKQSSQPVAILKSVGESGNEAIKPVLKPLIKKYKPKLVILCGIAAGVRSKIEIKDVFITNQVSDLRRYKALNDGDFEFMPVPRKSPGDITLKFEIKYLENVLNTKLQEKITIHVDGICGNGGGVIKNKKYITAAGKTHAKMIAYEMEALGVWEICESTNTPFFIVKSISDYGENGKDDSYHERCCQLAALTVVFGFLTPIFEKKESRIPTKSEDAVEYIDRHWNKSQKSEVTRTSEDMLEKESVDDEFTLKNTLMRYINSVKEAEIPYLDDLNMIVTLFENKRDKIFAVFSEQEILEFIRILAEKYFLDKYDSDDIPIKILNIFVYFKWDNEKIKNEFKKFFLPTLKNYLASLKSLDLRRSKQTYLRDRYVFTLQIIQELEPALLVDVVKGAIYWSGYSAKHFFNFDLTTLNLDQLMELQDYYKHEKQIWRKDHPRELLLLTIKEIIQKAINEKIS